MGQTIAWILFAVIGTFIYFELHYFFYKSITHALLQSKEIKRKLKYFTWLLGTVVYISVFIGRWLDFHLIGNHQFMIWLGFLSISCCVFVFYRIAALIYDNHAREIAVAALIVIVLLSVYAVVNGSRLPVVKKITIPMEQLPQELSGFKVVQLSDLHLNEQTSGKKITGIVDKVNKLEPDLVVITGDLIDDGGSSKPVNRIQLKRLKAKYGVIAVTGNHEFYTGLDKFLELTEYTGIKVLRNEFITVAGSLQIIGVDDKQGRYLEKEGPDLIKAMKGCDSSKPMILLNHRPKNFREARERGVDLQLSGHTHAGQIPPMDLLMFLLSRYSSGLYKEDNAYIYTSPGTGYWGPPMRIFSTPEITLLVLDCKKQ